MVTLEGDHLVFRFPDVHEEARLTVTLQRTLRIPDDDRQYPLPPGLGAFPLRHVDDYRRRLPKAWVERGGVLMPMHQAEAMWIRFRGDYPMAVTVATGKVNAITGSPLSRGLHRAPQDYLVTPDQPWLDGFCVEKGVIRQFVAMPLGQGYSVEEQIAQTAEHGGLQLIVHPLKATVYWKLQRERARIARRSTGDIARRGADMGLAPGGRMRQEVYEDPFAPSDWSQKHVSRCFITFVNATLWSATTGETVIRDRVLAGLRRARAQGIKLGRPKVQVDVARILVLRATRILVLRAQRLSIRAIAHTVGCSATVVAKALRASALFMTPPGWRCHAITRTARLPRARTSGTPMTVRQLADGSAS